MAKAARPAAVRLYLSRLYGELPDQFASTPACKAVKAKSSILRNVTVNWIILSRNASRKTKALLLRSRTKANDLRL
jgi:hypothetical protein